MVAALMAPTAAWSWPLGGAHATAAGLALAGLVVALAVSAWRCRRQGQTLVATQADLASNREWLDVALGAGDRLWGLDAQMRRIWIGRMPPWAGSEQLEEIAYDIWLVEQVHPEDHGRLAAAIDELMARGQGQLDIDCRLRDEHQGFRWTKLRARAQANESGAKGWSLRGNMREISALKEADIEARVARHVMRTMDEAVAVMTPDYRFVAVNAAFSRITGYEDGDIAMHSVSILDSSQHNPEFHQRIRMALDRSGHWQGEIWQQRKDGSEFLSWMKLSAVRDEDGQRLHLIAVLSDITQTRRTEQELRYLANYDTLTGLPNRTLLAERLSRAVIRARRGGYRVCVLLLDLDRFKDINDSMGHATGDRLLKVVASQLEETVGSGAIVARVGGDEFAMVIEDAASFDDVEQVAQVILGTLATPVTLDDRHRIAISASIGIAVFPDHAALPTDLLTLADAAMYAAKARGRNTHQIYNDTLDAESKRRARLLAALAPALAAGEFRLVFQPRIDLGTDRVVGVEALLRWHAPGLGDIAPAEFIPLAEECGLILPIGSWVLDEACRVVASWHRQGLVDITCSVNVSIAQLRRAPLPRLLREALSRHGLSPDRVELEVTESVVMGSVEQTSRTLDDLRGIGVRLAIDDFGTGYSSLAYLKRLPIDTLKIDKVLIEGLGDVADDSAIARAVIDMARSLALRVVAEGVETPAQLAFLREHGCHEVQGYLLSRPLEADDCLAFIRARRGDG